MTMDNMTGQQRIDFDAIRARLADSHGPTYWRSLEELAGTPEFQELLQREFPGTRQSGATRSAGASS